MRRTRLMATVALTLTLIVTATSLSLGPAAPASALPALGKVVAHPRLLADAEQFQQALGGLRQDDLGSEWLRSLSQRGEELARADRPTYDVSSGDLLEVSRSVLDRSYHFSFLWRQTGERRWLDLGRAELLNAASFRDWNPEHFLDTAEMMHALSLGYDWMYDGLSEQDRQTIRTALIDKGLGPARAQYTAGASWTRQSGNWNLVVNSAVGITALALGTEGSSISQASLDAANESIKHGLATYAPDGGFDEGLTYWSYGTSYLATYLDSLRTALNDDGGLSRSPGLSQTVAFSEHVVGPSSLGFAFGDAWQNEALTDASLGMEWVLGTAPTPDRAVGQPRTDIDAASPRGILWLGKGLAAQSPSAPPLPLDKVTSSAGMVSMRGAWNDVDTAFVAARDASTERTGHSDLDQGSFVFDALGENWITEKGADSYGLDGYFDVPGGERWRYYSKRAEGHSTLVTNPADKADAIPAKGQGAATRVVQSDGDAGAAIMDLQGARADLSTWRRGVRLFDGRKQLLVQDEITPKGSVDLWSFLQTRAAVTVGSDGRSATLYQGGKKVLVRLVGGPGTLRAMQDAPLWSSPQPSQKDFSRSTKLMVHTRVTAPTTFTLQLTPLPTDDVPAAVTPQAMSTWPSTSARNKAGSMTINGAPLPAFSPSQFSYTLTASVKGPPPVVGVAPGVGQEVRVTQATKVPGRATVRVTSGQQQAGLYTIDFVRGALPLAAPTTAPNGAHEALDRDRYSAWDVRGRQVLTLPLGQEQMVSHAELTWAAGDTSDTAYGIEVSADGRTWRRVYTGSPRSQGVAEWASFTTGPVPARHVRLIVNAGSTDRAVSLRHFELHGDNAPRRATSPAGDTTRMTGSNTPAQLKLGSTMQLSYAFEGAHAAAAKDARPTFTSTDPSVATVSSTGAITAKGAGRTNVGAYLTVGGKLLFTVRPITVTDPKELELTAVEDAHVHGGGSNATTTFGRAPAMSILHKPSYPAFDREGYVKFDIGTLRTSDVAAATLVVRSSLPGGTSSSKETLAARAVSSTWDEKTVTFEGRPSMGRVQGTGVVSAASVTTSIDVTDYVRSASGRSLSLGLTQTTQSPTTEISVGTKEGRLPATLLITYR
ncbi:CBM96 family carbohydrate-binding protein [Frigoribacterium salinisoli]